jgi:hypothetical protein
MDSVQIVEAASRVVSQQHALAAVLLVLVVGMGFVAVRVMTKLISNGFTLKVNGDKEKK